MFPLHALHLASQLLGDFLVPYSPPRQAWLIPMPMHAWPSDEGKVYGRHDLGGGHV